MKRSKKIKTIATVVWYVVLVIGLITIIAMVAEKPTSIEWKLFSLVYSKFFAVGVSMPPVLLWGGKKERKERV